MALTPNQTLKSFFSMILLSLALCSFASAAVMTFSKTLRADEEVTISIEIPAGKQLELIVSSRALPEPLTLKVPTTGLVSIKRLPAGQYILGLREVGATKYLKMEALRITEVLK